MHSVTLPAPGARYSADERSIPTSERRATPVTATMKKFDFDDWSELYISDPAAFEARRRAVLAVELAKVDPKIAGPARATLQRLDDQLEGKSDEERIRTSMIWMVASMRLLSARMRDLGDQIDAGDQIGAGGSMIPI